MVKFFTFFWGMILRIDDDALGVHEFLTFDEGFKVWDGGLDDGFGRERFEHFGMNTIKNVKFVVRAVCGGVKEDGSWAVRQWATGSEISRCNDEMEFT